MALSSFLATSAHEFAAVVSRVQLEEDRRVNRVRVEDRRVNRVRVEESMRVNRLEDAHRDNERNKESVKINRNQ